MVGVNIRRVEVRVLDDVQAILGRGLLFRFKGKFRKQPKVHGGVVTRRQDVAAIGMEAGAGNFLLVPLASQKHFALGVLGGGQIPQPDSEVLRGRGDNGGVSRACLDAIDPPAMSSK